MSETVDWRLLDEREFLQRSLEDAAREHASGDLDDEDYAILRARDEERLAAVDAALSSSASASASHDGATSASALSSPGAGRAWRRLPFVRWRRRWWLAAAGVALLAAAAILLVLELTAPRLPGQDATGSIDLNTAQQVERQLSQAQTLVNRGKATEALQLYGDVLSEDPRQPTALAEWGWLDWQGASRAKEATVAAEGASAVEESTRLDPGLFAAQYYLGSILLQEGDASKAVVHFAKFLTDHPTSKWLHDAAPAIRTAYAAAHRTVPAGVPKA